MDNIARGVPAEQAGPADEGSCGNGSLMRILPLALVDRELPARKLVERAHRASKVTHGHHRPQVACALYVLIGRDLLAGRVDRAQVLVDAQAELRGLYESADFAPDYLAALDHLEAWTERQGRGRVWDSFWSAWDAFAGADSYRQAIDRAIAYGNDTDTTAAIAGGLAGIYWGIDGIPAEWLAGMRSRDIVAPLVARLLAGAGYETSELRVNWVDLAQVPALRDAAGRLGMTFLPGKRFPGRAGAHWRDLETDAATLSQVHELDTLLLLVEDHELESAKVRGIDAAMDGQGIELLRHPVKDMGVPADPAALASALEGVAARVRAGERVAVACMGGLGRTGTIVGCLLQDSGLDADAAIGLARATRPGAIETDEQETFVRGWHATDETDQSISELVNADDLAAFGERADEPTLAFEDFVADLKRRGEL
jgi:protein-tyrosine phosphatase